LFNKLREFLIVISRAVGWSELKQFDSFINKGRLKQKEWQSGAVYEKCFGAYGVPLKQHTSGVAL